MLCDSCIFAKYIDTEDVVEVDDETCQIHHRQVGCKAGRLEEFKNQGKVTESLVENDAKVVYNIDGFCNMFRDKNWEDNQKSDDHVDAARKEVMPIFGVAIRHGRNNTVKELRRTIESIKNIDYPNNRVRLVVSSFIGGESKVSEVIHVVNEAKVLMNHCECVFHTLEHTKVNDTDIFRRIAFATYFVNIKSGATIPSDLFSKIDMSLNEDLDNFCMFEGEGYSIIFKKVVNMSYLDFNNYDEMVDYIRSLSHEQKSYVKI